MNDNNETWGALVKGAVMWMGVILGSITLSKLVLFATLIYTVMQIYILWRDKFRGNDGELR